LQLGAGGAADRHAARQTPGWRATRGGTRGTFGGEGRHPVGDSDEDSSGSDGGEGDVGEEEDEELMGEEEQPRYSRRVRTTVERFVPGVRAPRPPHSHALDDFEDDGEEEDVRGGRRAAPQPPSEHFSQRYSVRDRRTVDRFNPLKFEGGAPPPSGDGDGRKRRDRGLPANSSDDDDDDDDGEEPSAERQERRQYSFRDRALVTIKPGMGAGLGGGAPRQGRHDLDRKRHRATDRYGGRTSRGNGGRSRR
jgi:hypothetical protein